MGIAVHSCTVFIGLSVPSHPDCVFVPHTVTLPTRWSFWNNDVNCWFLHCPHCVVSSICAVSLSRCPPTLSVPSPWLGALLMPPSSHHRKYPCLDLCVGLCVTVYVFVWGISARVLACCALTARSFGFVSRMDVSLNGNWWVCTGSIRRRSRHVSFAVSTDVRYEMLSSYFSVYWHFKDISQCECWNQFLANWTLILITLAF